MSSPKPNVKTGRQEGWKPEKSAGQGNHFSWHHYCQTAENLFPSATSHQPLLSALSLLVSLSASQSKTLFFCFIRASLYHLNTELLGTSARAKNSPLFLFFFFFFVSLVLFVVGWLVGFCHSFCIAIEGQVGFPSCSPNTSALPQSAMMGCAWGEELWGVGVFNAWNKPQALQKGHNVLQLGRWPWEVGEPFTHSHRPLAGVPISKP